MEKLYRGATITLVSDHHYKPLIIVAIDWLGTHKWYNSRHSCSSLNHTMVHMCLVLTLLWVIIPSLLASVMASQSLASIKRCLKWEQNLPSQHHLRKHSVAGYSPRVVRVSIKQQNGLVHKMWTKISSKSEVGPKKNWLGPGQSTLEREAIMNDEN